MNGHLTSYLIGDKPLFESLFRPGLFVQQSLMACPLIHLAEFDHRVHGGLEVEPFVLVSWLRPLTCLTQ